MRLLLLPILLALMAPAAADASYRAPCIPGDGASPTCTWWNAKVTAISDGDTVDARIEGGPAKHIRFEGINAMELQTYSRTPSKRRGDCHGVEATAFIEKYIKRSRFKVRLAAQQASSRSGRRLRRAVWVRSGGKWKDLSKLEIAAGYALWLPNGVEWAHNLEYSRLAAENIAAQRNLYDPDFCGVGPDQDLPVSVVVNWDADGGDDSNVNGEYADIRNGGARPLSLAGWFFRDSFLRRSTKAEPPGYVFPATAVVPAGGSVRLRMGCGDDTTEAFFWCQDGSVFENAVPDGRHLGDGGYLFDPQRDLRASFIYPCMIACADGAAGKVRVSVHPGSPESVSVVNTSGAPVDVSDHILKLRNKGKAGQYVFGDVFGPGTTIAPGDELTYEPPRANVFSNNGGVIELRTLDDQLTACDAWGFGKC